MCNYCQPIGTNKRILLSTIIKKIKKTNDLRIKDAKEIEVARV